MTKEKFVSDFIESINRVEKLRDLERRWQETQTSEDEAAYLLERIRGGASVLKLRLAAFLRYPAALINCGDEYEKHRKLERRRPQVIIDLVAPEVLEKTVWFRDLHHYPTAQERALIASLRSQNLDQLREHPPELRATHDLIINELDFWEDRILDVTPDAKSIQEHFHLMAHHLMRYPASTARTSSLLIQGLSLACVIASPHISPHFRAVAPSDLVLAPYLKRDVATSELLSWALDKEDPVQKRCMARVEQRLKTQQTESRTAIDQAL